MSAYFTSYKTDLGRRMQTGIIRRELEESQVERGSVSNIRDGVDNILYNIKC